MVLRSGKKTIRSLSFLIAFTIACSTSVAQNEGNRLAKSTEQKDSTFNNFSKYRFDVAKAQINLLKNGGALLVRLKTNANTINRLKTAGSIDLATQVERQTRQENQIMMNAYRQEFNFCPVYFFYSDCTDSVKHQNLNGIFLDSTLTVNAAIVCTAKFYLVAEQASIYDSSLGLVPLSQANKAVERGAATKEAAIVVKNRYFIQLHKPFPYYQQGYNIKNYKSFVQKFNNSLKSFYEKNAGFVAPAAIQEFIY